MAKKIEKEKRVSEEELEKEQNKNKKKKTPYERKKYVLKVVGWVMAAVMLIGSLMGIFGMLVYYK